MADTTNYGWPLPNPLGNQQPEIQRIADALGLADEQVKALADLIAGLTFAAIGGVIANAQLPHRVRSTAYQGFADWNDANENGWWMESDALNAPGPGWWLGQVEVHITASYVTQTVFPFADAAHKDGSDTKVYRRVMTGGVWGAWYRLRWSQTEIQSLIDAAVEAGVASIAVGAPADLNTLAKLAGAIGNDPDFAATISAQIDSKLPAAQYTAADVLAKLKSVDGPGSGTNADLLDGLNSSAFLRADVSDTKFGNLTITGDLLRDTFSVVTASLLTTPGNYGNGVQVNADGFHTNGRGAAQLFFEGAYIDSNSTISIGMGQAGNQTPSPVQLNQPKDQTGALLLNANGTAAKASTLARNGGNGSPMTFNWSGQTGQPTYVWGSNDGTNHYVWNPSNFSVAYAANAGKLEGQDGSFYRNLANATGTLPSACLSGTYAINITGNANTLDGINSTGFVKAAGLNGLGVGAVIVRAEGSVSPGGSWYVTSSFSANTGVLEIRQRYQ